MSDSAQPEAFDPDQQTRPKGEAPSTPLNDQDLVIQAQAGEPWAMEELVKRYQRKAYGIAYHLCSESVQEAEDITQEAFLRAFQSLKHFRGQSSFYTWFYRIVVNLCLDRKRHWGRWHRIFRPWQDRQDARSTAGRLPEEDLGEAQDESALDLLRHKQLSKEIRRSLRSLPEKQRTAFQLKVLHGMSIREIAEVMKTAEGTVKSHLFRATQFLRQALKEWDQT